MNPSRYASLFFITGVEEEDNELITLEYIHHYVECLDRYFGNVCELDIIFNFHQVRIGNIHISTLLMRVKANSILLFMNLQAYYLLDEVFIGGLVQETSKKEILKVCAAQDDLLDDASDDKRKPSQPKPK